MSYNADMWLCYVVFSNLIIATKFKEKQIQTLMNYKVSRNLNFPKYFQGLVVAVTVVLLLLFDFS